MSADSPVVGLSLSPAMDMLATVHEGRRGVYLWANSQMYSAAPGPLKSSAASLAAADDEEDEEEAGGLGREVTAGLYTSNPVDLDP